jgi:hypothetical protein
MIFGARFSRLLTLPASRRYSIHVVRRGALTRGMAIHHAAEKGNSYP